MVVGLTGGIGSGKSTVLKEFQEIGNIAVYNADEEAKKLMVSSSVIRAKISSEFGSQSYTNNELNRPYISSVVFADKDKLSKLNAIVHPEVFKHFKNFVASNLDKEYVLYENAILFENGSDVLCDVIICVVASKQVRIQRVVKRDGVTETEVIRRIRNQWSDSKKRLLSNYIIHNQNVNKLQGQIIRIHNNLTENKAQI